MEKMNVTASGTVVKSHENRYFIYSKKELEELRKIRESTIVVIEDIIDDYDPLHGLRRLTPPKAKTAEAIVREAISLSKPPVPPTLAPKPKSTTLLHNPNVKEAVIPSTFRALEITETDTQSILEHAREYDAERAAYVNELERRRRLVSEYVQALDDLYRYIRDGLYSEAIKLSRNKLTGNFREEVIHELVASARAEAPVKNKAAKEYLEFKRQSEARKQLRNSLKTILGR